MGFNLRVYGIWIKEEKILLTHEQINDFCFTKFPGGGVEFGEGIKDALLRELYEETGLNPAFFKTHHFYTTDFYQQSVFDPNDQIISVYYLIKCDSEPLFFEKDESTISKKHLLKLEWLDKYQLIDSKLSFPIDKHVLKLLQEQNFI